MSAIDQIKSLGVVQVFTELYGTEWKREGTWLKTACPYHADESPSFGVGSERPDRGRCFSCDVRGDVIDLVAKRDGIEPAQAIRKVCEVFGIERGRAPRRARKKAPKTEGPKPIPIAHSKAYAKAMQRATLGGAAGLTPVRDYLEARGVYAAACAAKVGKVPLVAGVAADRMHGFHTYMGTEHKVWRDAGGGTFYRLAEARVGVLIFATLNLTGRSVAGLHLRVTEDVDPGLRYMQIGPDPRPWRAGPIQGGDVVICEGAIDALSWLTAGVQAIGLHGANSWKDWSAGVLPRGALPIVALDPDNAGRMAQAKLAADLKAAGWPVRVLELDPDAGDANAILLAAGPDGLREALKKAFEPGGRHSELDGGDVESDSELNSTPAPNSKLNGTSRSSAAADSEVNAIAIAGMRRPPVPDFGADLMDEEFEINPRAWARLDHAIEWAHWVYAGRKRDELQRQATVHPAHRLTDLVISWIEQEANGHFLRDSKGGAWLYVGGQLLRLDTRNTQFRGWLYSAGRINLADREGKVIAAALEQYAQGRIDAPEPRPWLWFDRAARVLAIHLHDDQDRLAIVQAGSVAFELNGADRLLMRNDKTRAIEMPDDCTAAWALSAIDSLILQSLATSPGERALIIAWALSAFLRHQLEARALIFAGGPAGAGKSELAKLITALFFGYPRPQNTTTAALWVEGSTQPLVALDNQESTQLASPELRQYLLTLATGIERQKRAEGTQEGLISQRVDALAMVTAIEPPGIDELIQRTMTVTFRHDLHVPGYNSAGTVNEIVAQRGRIMGGVLDLLAQHIIPRLDELPQWARRIPSTHPKSRLSDHLALCALIADACHQVRPTFCRPGLGELKEWLDLQAEKAGELARGTDVLLDAFERLAFAWNRILIDHGLRGGPYRSASEDAIFRCVPVYSNDGECTLNERHATLHLAAAPTFAVVVGFQGSYSDLHADLLRACRDTSGGDGFKKRVGSPAVLSARWGHNNAIESAGWKAEFVRRSSRQGRIYRWLAPVDDTQAVGVTVGVTMGVTQKGPES